VVIPLMSWLFLWAAKSAPLDAIRYGEGILPLWKAAILENASFFGRHLPIIALCWLLFRFGKSEAGRMLFIFLPKVVILLSIAVVIGGKTAIWCVVACWPLHLGRIFKYLQPRARRHRYLQEPSFIAPCDGDSRRGDPAAAPPSLDRL